MPLTNAERQRRFREKHGMGVDRGAREPLILDIPELEPLDKLTPQKPMRETELTEKTKKRYTSSVKNIYKEWWGKDIADDHPIFKGLKNKKVLFKEVKDFNFLNVINVRELVVKNNNDALNMLHMVRFIPGFNDFKKKIIPYRIWLEENYHERRAEKTVEPISFDREDIIRRMNLLEDNDHKIVYGLMMLIPARRIGEYRNTIIPDAFTPYPNNYNYYVDGKILIYNAKSDTRPLLERNKDEPIYVVDVPEEIQALIDKGNKFIITKPINIGYIFNLVYGHPYTNAEIRRLYATHIKDTKYNKRKELADAMGHSVSQNLKYVL